MDLLLGFILAAILVGAITWFVRKIAVFFKVFDYPVGPRKIHQQPTPLLGGVAVFAGLFIVLFLFVVLAPQSLVGHYLQLKQLIGVFIGGFILVAGGILDEKYNLKPSHQMVFSIAAVLAVIACGVGVREITNPFGGLSAGEAGTISLVSWEKTFFWWHGTAYRLSLPADLITFIWLLVIIYTTKFLDGLDGLVSGITVIGALTVAFLATLTKWYQPEVALMSVIVAGAFLGFLFWNWHPAKMFLGNSGSTLAGFLLGVLAIISGSKIATTLLVLGVPVLDVAWVVGRRIVWEKKSPAQADRKHLHFRLLDVGFSHRGAVLFLYLVSALFGVAALFLQSKEKVIALIILGVFMVGLAVFAINRRKND